MKNDKTLDHTNDNISQRYLAFSLGAEEYLVPLDQVKEVIELPVVTPVPKTPNYYLGIMNLRGQVVSVVDLRLKLKGVKQEHGKKSALVIIDFGTFAIGIVAGSVNRVMTTSCSEIQDRPPMETTESLGYISGVVHKDHELCFLLDVAKALNVDDLQLMQAQKAA